MRSKNIFNLDRVNSLSVEPNAYVMRSVDKKLSNPQTQGVSKVVFPEPYENAHSHYSRNEFSPPPPPETPPQQYNHQPSMPMFDIKSLLPLLTQGGNMMDMLKPLMSMFGGGKTGGNGGLGDISKIFEIFKPKNKPQNVKCETEDNSSKFDDMNIIID